jgi:hypothetical protein
MRRPVSIFSVFWLVAGLLIGLGGALFYTTRINPLVLTNISVSQLDRQGKRNQMMVLSLAYVQSGDIVQAAERLNALGLDWPDLANAACEMAQNGDAGTSSGLIAIRAMVQLAGSQGARGCAESIVPLAATATPNTIDIPTVQPSPTITLTAVASKTPTEVPIASNTPELPTATPPSGDFAIVLEEAVCDASLQNVIQVSVRDANDTGLPAIAILAISGAGREVFYTGFKPEIDPGFADVEMTPGETYQIELPERSGRSRRFEAGQCTTGNGGTALASYRIVFKRVPQQ